jgi:hypothetical protein
VRQLFACHYACRHGLAHADALHHSEVEVQLCNGVPRLQESALEEAKCDKGLQAEPCQSARRWQKAGGDARWPRDQLRLRGCHTPGAQSHARFAIASQGSLESKW